MQLENVKNGKAKGPLEISSFSPQSDSSGRRGPERDVIAQGHTVSEGQMILRSSGKTFFFQTGKRRNISQNFTNS